MLVQGETKPDAQTKIRIGVGYSCSSRARASAAPTYICGQEREADMNSQFLPDPRTKDASGVESHYVLYGRELRRLPGGLIGLAGAALNVHLTAKMSRHCPLISYVWDRRRQRGNPGAPRSGMCNCSLRVVAYLYCKYVAVALSSGLLGNATVSNSYIDVYIYP